MGTNCTTALWLSLTIIFTAGVIFSVLSPVWFQNDLMTKNTTRTRPQTRPQTLVSFGLLRYCRRMDIHDVLFNCQFYKKIDEMPSIAWIISTVIYTTGTGLFVLSIILASFGMCAGHAKGERLRISIAYVQIIAVGFLAIAVLMFPLGLDSDFARSVCGPKANMYMPADCQVAWGYVLGIMAVSLTIFCPILAKYSTEVKIEDDDEFSYSEYECKSDIVSLTPSSNSKITTTV